MEGWVPCLVSNTSSHNYRSSKFSFLPIRLLSRDPHRIGDRQQHDFTTNMGFHASPQPWSHLCILLLPNSTSTLRFILRNILESLFGGKESLYRSSPRKVVLGASQLCRGNRDAAQKFSNRDGGCIEDVTTRLSSEAMNIAGVNQKTQQQGKWKIHRKGGSF